MKGVHNQKTVTIRRIKGFAVCEAVLGTFKGGAERPRKEIVQEKQNREI